MHEAWLRAAGAGDYAVGQLFMPKDERLRAHCTTVWNRICQEEGFEVIGWREMPGRQFVAIGDDVR